MFVHRLNVAATSGATGRKRPELAVERSVVNESGPESIMDVCRDLLYTRTYSNG